MILAFKISRNIKDKNSYKYTRTLKTKAFCGKMGQLCNEKIY